MTKTYFDLIGEDNVWQLIADFYEGIKTNEILRPMYPDALEPAQERLFLFIMQYLGGPGIYGEQRGHPRLRMRHVRFQINQQARDAWMANMKAAIEKNAMPEQGKEFLLKYFDDTATFLMN
ncbi:MAG: globin [Bacteroidales bacterium]|nr:globin [Bacteroidales bacterium]